jgi:2',3'-cyclic-nucleotide 2'-phosphodiesterase/3'-nucleotidase
MKIMAKIFRQSARIVILFILLSACAGEEQKNITILETTDVHGVILPFDFIEKKSIDVSLASTFTYVRQLRKDKEAVILLDDGDNLQGQPAVYYYNFIDTLSPHLLAEVMNFMDYDAVTVGNHDVETGHSVYDRLVKEYKFPLLAANAVNVRTGEPYFKPYSIIRKNGIRIAVLGLVTPSIHNTLPRELYEGVEFRDMIETARHWMPLIKKENPDLIIGLFHAGWFDPDSESSSSGSHDDEGTTSIAYNIPGFDIIFTGHDHKTVNKKIVNISGDTVLILNGGSRSMNIARADVTFEKDKKSGIQRKTYTGQILKVADYKPDDEFINKFTGNHDAIRGYVDEVIGNSSETISSRDSYFGSSAFVDMIHSLQLEITGADISFAAPLSFDVNISEGPVTVGDMFKLYRFENMLYTIALTGEEILKYLEYSYSGWYNTISGTDDLLLKFRTDKKGKLIVTDGNVWLKNPAYNFDSAAGIDYVVDVSKPEGSRVTISGLTGGGRFDKDETYRVAVNSYRGNGGGGHLSEGVGLSKPDMMSRIIKSTDRDLRYYMIESIRQKKQIKPAPLNNWKLIPEDIVSIAAKNDFRLLFGEDRK